MSSGPQFSDFGAAAPPAQQQTTEPADYKMYYIVGGVIIVVILILLFLYYFYYGKNSDKANTENKVQQNKATPESNGDQISSAQVEHIDKHPPPQRTENNPTPPAKTTKLEAVEKQEKQGEQEVPEKTEKPKKVEPSISHDNVVTDPNLEMLEKYANL
jgi:hypothetical protein